MIKKTVFLFAFVLAFLTEASATHLIGGNLGYTYLGNFGNNFRYKITFKTYLDCNSEFWGNGFPENSLTLGFYEGNSTPSGNLPLKSTLDLPLVSSLPVNPDIPNNCTIGGSPCMYEVVYEATIDLPMTFLGYYMYYDRCCRNESIINLNNPGTQANPFYAFIPPSLVVNSSPTFADAPSAFLCVNDTTSLLNTAFDPDGDKLIFSFVDPYRGYADDVNPAPGLPPNLNFPIPTVNWGAGYSKNQPFGSTGYAYLNSATGLTKYKPVLTGNFVVAVEIKEYRNDVLIGITRRDLQYLAVSCPANQPPQLSQSINGGTTQFEVVAGNTLCFPVTVTDASNQTITLSSNGLIFNPSYANPTASINTPQTGTGNVSADFCWTPGCHQASSIPYLFTASATDDGCPPKTTNMAYVIEVKSFEGPASIIGAPLVCQNQQSVSYSVSSIPGASYTWSITGGSQAGGSNSNSITVDWGNNPGAGEVKVFATSDKGCLSEEIKLDITILATPLVNAGIDTICCIGDSIRIGGSPTGPPGSSFAWSPATGLSSSSVANPYAQPMVSTLYVVSVINGSCSASDSVFISAGIIVEAGNNQTLCFNDSIQLNASTGMVSYQWNPSEFLSADSIGNPWTRPDSSLQYLVSGTDSLGCISVDSLIITINPLPLIDAGNDTTVCKGTELTIGGNPTGSQNSVFSWFPGIGLNDTALANPNLIADSSRMYFVLVTDSNGCKNTDSILIVVNTLPVITKSNDTTVCYGESVPLSISGGTAYSWTPSAWLNDTSILNPVSIPQDSIMYYVFVTDANGCEGHDSIHISVNPLPNADAGENQWICPGDNVMLNASGGISFSWTPTLGLSNPNIANPVAEPADSTLYFVTVTDTNACINNDSAYVGVNDAVPTFAGNDTIICFGDTAMLGGNPTSPNGTIYSWSPAVTLNDPTIANPLAFPTITTTYYLVTSNDTCVGYDTITVFVNPLPVANAGNDTAICIGDTIQLFASGGESFTWIPALGLSDDSISNPFAFPSDTVDYIVMVTDSNTCSKKDTILITVNYLPLASAGADTTMCFGDSIQLNAGGGNIYLWTPVTGLSSDVIPNPYSSANDTTTYIVLVIDSNQCKKTDTVTVTVNSLPPADAGTNKTICVNDTVSLSASGGEIYAWFPNVAMNDSTLINPAVFPSDSMYYYVLVTDSNNCRQIDSVRVSVNVLPIVYAGEDTSICIGNNVQLGASGGDIYSWTPSQNLNDSTLINPTATPLSTTDYIVVVTDTNLCASSDTVQIIVNPLPLVDAGLDTNICNYGQLYLSASGADIYSWTPATNIQFPDSSQALVNPNITTQYYVNGTDTNGCVNSDSVTVFVFRISTSATDSLSMCENDSVTISATADVSASFIWSPAESLKNPDQAQTIASPLISTNYQVIGTDAKGCADTSLVYVEVNKNPTASFNLEITPVCDGVTAAYANLSSFHDNSQWILPHGTFSGYDDFTQLYPYNSENVVYLVAGTTKGCSDTLKMPTTIADFKDYFEIIVPNVFTPNGDGKNDTFFVNVKDQLADCIDMQIFNRWGKILYRSSEGSVSWDGKALNGEKVPNGVYFYIINVNGIEFRGNVSLLD